VHRICVQQLQYSNNVLKERSLSANTGEESDEQNVDVRDTARSTRHARHSSKQLLVRSQAEITALRTAGSKPTPSKIHGPVAATGKHCTISELAPSQELELKLSVLKRKRNPLTKAQLKGMASTNIISCCST
jgi:hypothetical protein